MDTLLDTLREGRLSFLEISTVSELRICSTPPISSKQKRRIYSVSFAWNSWRGIEPPTFSHTIMLSSYRSGVAVRKRALISVGFAPPIAKGVQNPGVRYSPEHPDNALFNRNGVAVRKRALISVGCAPSINCKVKGACGAAKRSGTLDRSRLPP